VLSRNLQVALHRACLLAKERRHEYATLEHLLFGLADDNDTAVVLRECGVDLDRLRADLRDFVDKDLFPTDRPGDPKITARFQQVVQRAAIQVQSSGRTEVEGVDVIAALVNERDSPAVYFLQSAGYDPARWPPDHNLPDY
jgi:ATP-dependent Clp protease ATP-binding subunit ClpA